MSRSVILRSCYVRMFFKISCVLALKKIKRIVTVLYPTRACSGFQYMLSAPKLQSTVPPQGCSREPKLTWFKWITGMPLWFKMTHENSRLITSIQTHSQKYDQHNTSHSFRDLYYEINQVRESFTQWRWFPSHQGSACLCQRVPGRSTILHIIS